MGVTIKVDWHDIDQLAKDLEALPGAISREVQKAQEDDFEDVAAELAKYPPQLPGTHYQRTGALKRGWLGAKVKIDVLGGSGLNFTAQINNPVEYAGAVQGGPDNNPEQSAEFKRRNWKSVDEVLNQSEAAAQKRVDDAVQRAIDKQLGK